MLKSTLNYSVVYLPSFYFYKKLSNNNGFEFLFLNKFFYKSFLRHFLNFYNSVTICYFFKIKVRGLGYRVRSFTNNFCYFYFNYTNYYFVYLPTNIIIKTYKTRALFFGFNWFLLKLIISNILLFKTLGPYRLLGIRVAKQIILKKKVGKVF